MSDHVQRNRSEWNRWAGDWVEPGQRAWSQDAITWGELHFPETELGVIGDVAGKDVLELGCGTAYFSAWLMQLGASVCGLDVSERQLETARRFQQQFGVAFPLIQANAEYVPFCDSSFDLVVSEYGASIWADPYLWVPEASRLLRPGGELIFLANATLAMLTMPDEDEVLPVDDRLLRPFFGLYRSEWKTDKSVEFHLGHGEWIRLLRENRFEVEALHELQAPAQLEPSPRSKTLSVEWARQWPFEEIWKARKRTS